MSITVMGIPFACSAFILEAGPLAKATDALLRRKHEAMGRYWDDMLHQCLSEKDPSPATSRWLKSQQVSLASGKLCRERAQKLIESNLVPDAGSTTPLTTLEDEHRAFAYTPPLYQRIGYALLPTVSPLVLIASGASLEAVALSSLLGLILTLILICDVRARIIPYQACIAYGLTSIAWVLTTQSFDVAFSSCVLALISAVVLSLVERAALAFTSASAIGAGDRRLIPLICFQVGLAGLFPGLVGLCLVAGFMATVALIRGGSRRAYLPFAPALVSFALVGTLWPMLPFA